MELILWIYRPSSSIKPGEYTNNLLHVLYMISCIQVLTVTVLERYEYYMKSKLTVEINS